MSLISSRRFLSSELLSTLFLDSPLVSPSFNSYQKNSVNFKDVPFELWEIKKFEKDIISLTQHLASSKESIEKLSGGKNNVIGNVNKEVKVLSEEDTLKNRKVNKMYKEIL